MPKEYYISACVFTAKHQHLSALLQNYVRDRHGLEIVRCCVPNYKLQEFSSQMDAGRRKARDARRTRRIFRPATLSIPFAPTAWPSLKKRGPRSRPGPYGN